MSTSPFIYNGQPSRVIFGQGSLQQLEAEIDRLGAKRALVLCTPEQRAQAENIAQLLGSRAAEIFDKAVAHFGGRYGPRFADSLWEQMGLDPAHLQVVSP